jgi:hypothetical protein
MKKLFNLMKVDSAKRSPKTTTNPKFSFFSMGHLPDDQNNYN